MTFIKLLLALGLNPANKTRHGNNTCKINNNNSQSHSVVRLDVSTTVPSFIESTNLNFDDDQMDIDQENDNQTESKYCRVKGQVPIKLDSICRGIMFRLST